MGIPISEYIDVNSKVLTNTIGERDLSGLVFTNETMLATVPDEYNTIKTDYSAGKAVSLSYNGVIACFGSSAKVSVFASKYFGYSTSTNSPKVLNVAKYTTGSEKDAYDAVIAEFTNFGSFTFLGADIDNLVDIAAVAKQNKSQMFIAVDDNEVSWPATFKFEGVHCVIGKPVSGTNYASWMPMAWYACVNYSLPRSAATIDYKEFNEEATVTTLEGKTAADAAMMNYIGQVQVYGTQLKFYQKGVNGDGVDLGVYRDKVWLESEVEIGWFNLVGGANRIPANDSGIASVYSMLVGIANDSKDNGIILADKPLSNVAKQKILTYTSNPKAIGTIQSEGYYIETKLVQDGDSYICQYLLIYAKGDHIGKVEGSHVLA